jgi:hypothetical protein
MPRNHTPRSRAAERNVRAPVALTLRFDEALRQQLEEAANSAFRSLNSEINFRLLSTFKRETSAN